jgi:hypothetical protein
MEIQSFKNKWELYIPPALTLNKFAFAQKVYLWVLYVS